MQTNGRVCLLKQMMFDRRWWRSSNWHKKVDLKHRDFQCCNSLNPAKFVSTKIRKLVTKSHVRPKFIGVSRELGFFVFDYKWEKLLVLK
jgi:hypothetical protein